MPTFAELYLLAMQGDERAAREVLEPHIQVVYRVAYRLLGNQPDAEDAVQETFLWLQQRRSTRPPANPELLRATLICAGSHMAMRIRHTAQHRPKQITDGIALTARDPEPGAAAELSEFMAAYLAALDELNARDRQLIVLKLEGYSYKEMAGILGCPVTTVTMALAHARDRFFNCLAARCSTLPQWCVR